MHLKIIDFINQNKDWRDILSEAPYYLSIKDDGEYTILKYNQISSDFSDDYVKESRGLIIRKDGDNYIPVCVPFLKFFNFGEPNAADIDWSSAKTYEKIDGSLVKIWYDRDEWHISTNGTIDAYKAEVQAGFTKQSYGELIKKVLDRDYKDFLFDKNKVYLFEFTSPENRVIIRYTEDRLWLLSIRDKNTWDEEEISFDWKWRPKEYNLNNISDCIKNAEELGSSGEGYVVVDRYWNRIKVKSPAYISLSHLVGAGFSAKRILEIIFEGEVDEVLSYFPEYKVHFDEAQKAYENYISTLQQSIQSAKIADSKFVEKRDKAKYIINQAKQFHQCSDIGFKWLGNKDLTVEEYINNIKERYGIGKLIDNILEVK